MVDEKKREREEVDDDGAETPSTKVVALSKSEMFQLKLNNLAKFVSQKDVKKALGDCKYGSLKKVHNLQHAVVYFETKDDLDAAKAHLATTEIKGKIAECVVIEKNSERDAPVRLPKKDKVIENDTRTLQERLNDQTAPLWRMPYEEQLKKKTLHFKNAIGKLKARLMGTLVNKDIQPENKKPLMYLKRNIGQRKLCLVEDCIPAPATTDYRNKCELTFGVDPDGMPVCGFMLGLFKDGIVSVASADDHLLISSTARLIATAMQDHVRSSPHPIFDRYNKEGFWRLMQVRTYETGESMVLIQTNVDYPGKNVEAEQKSVLERFAELRSSGKLDVTTILWQESGLAHNGMSDAIPFTLLYGPGYCHEELMGLRFRISPTAFFQVNTAATVNLYGKLREWCSLEDQDLKPVPIDEDVKTIDAQYDPPGIVLLDLCCGTGTIGMTMAKSVKKVIGVDIVAEAIKDAKENALANGVSNSSYVAGRVEDVIRDVVKNEIGPSDTVVAVLDPPRAGVATQVVTAVRGCAAVKRVLYVSCDFNQSSSNIFEPKSNKFPGVPFRLHRAVPVDLFPNTDSCELILELRRTTDECFASSEGEAATGEGGEARVNEQNYMKGEVEPGVEAENVDGDNDAKLL